MDNLEENRSLSVNQRRKRALNLKRRQRRIQMQRERKKHRFADKKQLQRRAAKLAKSMLRDRIAGKGKGSGYAKLSTSEKIVIDNLVNKPQYRKRMKRLAGLLLPLVRRGEMTRVQDIDHGKNRVKTTGGVGRLHASYQPEGDVLSESSFDERLKRLLLAGLGDKKDIQLYTRLLNNTKDYAKITKYRKQILEFLDKFVEMVLGDQQLFHRAEILARRNKLTEMFRFGKKKEKTADEADQMAAHLHSLIKSGNHSAAKKHIAKIAQRADYHRAEADVASGGVDDYHNTSTPGLNHTLMARKLEKLHSHASKLYEDTKLDTPAEIGTDELTRRYAEMTPGQLKTIKKVVKESLLEFYGQQRSTNNRHRRFGKRPSSGLNAAYRTGRRLNPHNKKPESQVQKALRAGSRMRQTANRNQRNIQQVTYNRQRARQ